MSIVQTVLVYVGIPAAAFAMLAVLVYGRGGGRPPRYRPGRGWAYQPVWYLPRPLAGPTSTHSVAALTGGAAVDVELRRTARGGASGTW